MARAAGAQGRLEGPQSEQGVREGVSCGVGDQANLDKVQQICHNTGGARVEEVNREEGLTKLGECSKQMEIEWKNRETEKGVKCNQVELINIPVQGGVSREPLANITNTEIPLRAVAKANGRRKWKRIDSRKRERLGKMEGKKTPTVCGGSKRPWKLRDEIDNVCMDSEENEKRRKMENSANNIAVEVEVASLDWLQSNQ